MFALLAPVRGGGGPVTTTEKTFPQCFTPGELDALNIHPLPRQDVDIKMATGNWDAARVQGHVWHILMGETMGFNSRYFETNADSVDCCHAEHIFPETDIFLENWNSYNEVLSANEACAEMCSVAMCGFTGKEGIYYSSQMNDFTYVDEVLNIPFPADKFWDPEDVEQWKDSDLIDAIRPYGSAFLADAAGVEDNSASKWFIPTWCKDPRVAPADQDASKDDCAEWIFHSYTYGPHYMQVIVNLELRVTVSWWQGRAGTILKHVLTNNLPGFVYYWTPDPILVQFGDVSHIAMKPYSDACFADNTNDIETGIGSVDCERATSDLHRIARNTVFDAHPDAKHFFDSMTIEQSELDAIFQRKSASSDVVDWHEPVCTWLKENPSVWQDWVKNG